jgi:hypothetical protein
MLGGIVCVSFHTRSDYMTLHMMVYCRMFLMVLGLDDTRLDCILFVYLMLAYEMSADQFMIYQILSYVLGSLGACVCVCVCVCVGLDQHLHVKLCKHFWTR